MLDMKIVGLKELSNTLQDYNPTHVISILDPNHKGMAFGEVQLHQDKFNDICDRNFRTAPTVENIKGILKFTENIRLDSRLLIHCHLGRNRSTAAALGVMVQQGLTEDQAHKRLKQIRPQAEPNKLMLELFDEVLGCNLSRKRKETPKPAEPDYWEDKPYGGVDNYLSMREVHHTVASTIIQVYPELNHKWCVLDVGGGPGVHAELIRATKECFVSNMDSSEICRKVMSKAGMVYVKAPIENDWPYPEAFFDLVYSIQTLEHIHPKYMGHVAEQCFKMIPKGGKCFISVALEHMTDDPDHVCLKPHRS